MIAGTVLLLLGKFLPIGQTMRFVLMTLALLAAGYPIFMAAVKHLIQGRVLDEMFLMAFASLGAFCIGEYFVGVMVMLLYTVGE